MLLLNIFKAKFPSLLSFIDGKYRVHTTKYNPTDDHKFGVITDSMNVSIYIHITDKQK